MSPYFSSSFLFHRLERGGGVATNTKTTQVITSLSKYTQSNLRSDRKNFVTFLHLSSPSLYNAEKMPKKWKSHKGSFSSFYWATTIPAQEATDHRFINMCNFVRAFFFCSFVSFYWTQNSLSSYVGKWCWGICYFWSIATNHFDTKFLNWHNTAHLFTTNVEWFDLNFHRSYECYEITAIA